MHALLVALVLSQTIYVWTDAKGVEHFTDDQSTVPRGAKVRTTAGNELNVVSSDTPETKPAVVAPAPKNATSCDAARAQVSELEKKRADQAIAQTQLRDAEARSCQQVLATRGQGDYARCTAGIEQRVQAASTQQDRELSRQLEAAREALRKAQVDGCR
ncbi:MAG: hypothetical protein DI536_35070 [Archangium gephyra]|uniref:DUF4124 domain-containing protein n=1 Tax=Archangium gephyra TaxID=48 RepID=A0A2W5UL44_9BACT|nr:MAG: hypothetical protein DI536_35070 [Archangium gephyra]